MLRLFIAAGAAAMLAACSYDIMMINQKSGAIATGTAISEGGKGSITVDLNGTHYAGRWVFLRNGGTGFTNSFGATPAFSTVGFTGGGNGRANLSAEGGKSLRCEFQYSDMSGSGLGVCQDHEGQLYDLQIN
jgi:hypothetical protein